MDTHTELFSDAWLKNAANASEGSWALDVVHNLDSTGQYYLDWITGQYQHFAAIDWPSLHLRNRLENYESEDHLGGVNELVSFSYLRKQGFEVIPIETTKEPRPDFHVIGGEEFFVEASTLNVSYEDHIALTKLAGAELKQDRTIERIFKKLTDKKEQFEYGEEQNKSSVLFLFDFSAHSSYGVQTAIAADIALNKQDCAYFSIPRSLSALVFVTSHVIDGIPAIHKFHTTIFHNPLAMFELFSDPFHDIVQHKHGVVIEPGTNGSTYIHLGDET